MGRVEDSFRAFCTTRHQSHSAKKREPHKFTGNKNRPNAKEGSDIESLPSFLLVALQSTEIVVITMIFER